ncbi:RNA methyltransferase [Paenibacillus sp. CAA11]|uniref:TRM11 family SAM-dependent methyltransferase n=1 Tax=Paenibacillus sp. CAA11 TaxID=1532905 RepID=UPI000D33360F|nr:RsmD family RNA methyltransferase [Paenibacillus sp. CAA11]AWB43649.1 RNA methyltransferase [Paenibacillus sp. CAA11]
MNKINQGTFIYTYACHEDELELCELELGILLNASPCGRYVESSAKVDPSRSPFVHERIAVQLEAPSLAELAVKAEGLELGGQTFKLLCVDADNPLPYEEKRANERLVGQSIRGRAQMKRPDRLLGLAYAGGRWVLGECQQSEPVWLRHNDKPRHYSTALSTRVARAAVNIAVPRPEGIRLVDPCCGIGTVLIEALSMDIDAEGYDLNPLAVRGARENLQHLGMPDIVRVGDIRQLQGRYDALILDLPYNLCSVLTKDEQLELLHSAYRLAERVVIISAEPADEAIREAGLQIQQRCSICKGRFVRQLLLCFAEQSL